MEVLRQHFIERGWKQGVILELSCVDSEIVDCVGFLVLTQTCDCINPSFEKEPHLELLPIREVEGSPDKGIVNGRNPRLIQFQILDKEKELWVEARICEIFPIDRSTHASLSFSSNLSVGASLDSIVAWRVARYSRTAYPDGFVNAFRSISSKFGRRIKKEGRDQHVHSLLLSLQPFRELEEQEEYEVQILLMTHPIVLGTVAHADALQSLAGELEELLEGVECFDSPMCGVVSLNDMNLMQRESYLDFTDYDYLSFGDE